VGGGGGGATCSGSSGRGGVQDWLVSEYLSPLVEHLLIAAIRNENQEALERGHDGKENKKYLFENVVVDEDHEETKQPRQTN